MKKIWDSYNGVYKVILVFVHDTKFKEDVLGNYYTGGSYNNKVWERYLNISEELSIIARKENNIYSTEYAKQNFNIFENSKIKFIEVPDTITSFNSYLNRKKFREKCEIIKAEVLKSDFLIVRLPSYNGNVAIDVAKKFKKPYMVEVVACPWDAFWNHSIKGKVAAPFMYLATKKRVRDAAYAIYVTNEFLQRRYKCKGKTLGCSDVELPDLDDSILKMRINKIRNFILEKPIVLGTTAAVNVGYKGQEYVIHAISKLNEEGYNYEYCLAGGGDNRHLKSMAEKYGVADKIKFLGSLPHDKIFEYLDKIDIYIHPSKVEGLPRALLEAMGRGCPSIGSNIGGIPELLNKNCMFHHGSVDQICALIKSMKRDVMIREAEYNFMKAKEYSKDLLDRKRDAFYSSFVEQVKNNGF